MLHELDELSRKESSGHQDTGSANPLGGTNMEPKRV